MDGVQRLSAAKIQICGTYSTQEMTPVSQFERVETTWRFIWTATLITTRKNQLAQIMVYHFLTKRICLYMTYEGAANLVPSHLVFVEQAMSVIHIHK